MPGGLGEQLNGTGKKNEEDQGGSHTGKIKKRHNIPACDMALIIDPRSSISDQETFFTAAGFQPAFNLSMSGQYMRSNRLNAPAGAGSQFTSLSFPGVSFWM